MRYRHVILLFSLIFATGCSSDPLTYSEYQTYLANPENGLRKIRNNDGIVVAATLLPSAFRKHRLPNSSSVDSTVGLLLTLKYDESSKPESHHDVAIHGVRSLEEFLRRAEKLNFAMESDLKLVCGEGVYECVLAVMDNSYGLSNERRFSVLFAPLSKEDVELFTSENIELTYRDQHFGVGRQKFLFDRADLLRAPKLIIEKSEE